MDEIHICEDLLYDKQTGICDAKSTEIIKVISSYFYQVVLWALYIMGV